VAPAFRLAADAATRRDGPGVRRLRAHLARVTGASGPALDALVRAGMRSYARYWREVFRLPATAPERIVSGMRIRDEARLRSAYASRRGVLLVLPHSGNWDHAGAWACLTGMPLTTVAERLEPAALFDRFVAFRRGLGMEVLPLTGGERPVYDVLGERLRAGGLVCLLADRDLSRNGVPVRLFGAPASMPPGPAVLALRTGAALLPTTLWYDGPDWGARIHPEVTAPAGARFGARVSAMTQAVADVFASGPDGIADHPQDWHMLQPLWADERTAA